MVISWESGLVELALRSRIEVKVENGFHRCRMTSTGSGLTLVK
jgi:hypothetical protein